VKPDHAVAVIGGGQAGLETAYYLRWSGLDFRVFDAGDGPGGAWCKARIRCGCSRPLTARFPGWPMPRRVRRTATGFPSRDRMVAAVDARRRRPSPPLGRPHGAGHGRRDGNLGRALHPEGGDAFGGPFRALPQPGTLPERKRTARAP
jgi:cation diffusion facilitator CzcD-associated flavoprotein CzcO